MAGSRPDQLTIGQLRRGQRTKDSARQPRARAGQGRAELDPCSAAASLVRPGRAGPSRASRSVLSTSHRSAPPQHGQSLRLSPGEWPSGSLSCVLCSVCCECQAAWRASFITSAARAARARAGRHAALFLLLVYVVV